MLTRLRARLAAAVGLAALLVACSSGGVNTTPIPQPVGIPSSATFTSSVTNTVALPLIGIAGITVGGVFGVATAAATIAESIVAALPTALPPLSVARAADVRQQQATAGGNKPLVSLQFVTPVTMSVAAGTTLVFTFPQLTPGATYDLASFTPAGGWTEPFAGPATQNGTTLTFAPAYSIAANTVLTFAVYSTSGSATASPSPNPSASPTATASASPSPAPTSSPVIAPDGLAFDLNSPAPASVTVSEPGYAAPFTGVLLCSIATPAPSPLPTASAYVALLTSSATPSPSTTGGSVTYAFQPGLEGGTCAFTVTDTHGASTSMTVINGTSAVHVFSLHRN